MIFKLLLMLGLCLSSGIARAAPSNQAQSQDKKIEGLFYEGLQRQQEKRYAEAIMAYRRAIKLDPGQPETLSNLGFCYKQMRDYKKAVECYKQAIALKPDLAETHEYLGEAYVQMGKLGLAREQHKILLTLNAEEAKELEEKINAAAAR